MIDKLKSILFSIVVLLVLGLIGYWAIVTLPSGSDFKLSQKVSELQKQNDALTKQVSDLTDQLSTQQSQQVASTTTPTQNTTTNTNTTTTTPKTSTDTSTKPVTYKNQDLIDALQRIVNANIVMDLKSSGTRVGTVQKFLNLYNKTSLAIDNDYGASTQKAVMAFQKDQGLTSDGRAGPGTFNKMISWLKNQG